MELTTEFWASVAAGFSALCAFASWKSQETARVAGFRPDIVIEGWTVIPGQVGETSITKICFDPVKNIGQGGASGVYINAHSVSTGHDMTMCAGTVHRAFLAPQETWISGGQFVICWDNASAVPPTTKTLEIVIKAYDAEGRQYEVTYSMWISRVSGTVGLFCEVAPGVHFATRKVRIRSRSVLYLSNRYNRVFGKSRLAFRSAWASISTWRQNLLDTSGVSEDKTPKPQDPHLDNCDSSETAGSGEPAR